MTMQIMGIKRKWKRMLPVLLAALLWAEGMMGTAYAMETVSLEIPAADAEEGELSEPEESAEEEADEPEEEKPAEEEADEPEEEKPVEEETDISENAESLSLIHI